MRIAQDALPKDWMRDAKIRTDEDDHVGFLEIFVSERWRVEAEGLFVGRDGSGHALAGVTIAVDHAHAELGEGAEKGHFLGDHLAGADEGDGGRTVFVLD